MHEIFKDALLSTIGDSWICYGKQGKIKDGGRLIVAGGGIGVRDLLKDADFLLESVDHVMVCLADTVTQSYIFSRRPDTIDLSSFYSDSLDRNATYVQMAEMMLAPIRNGKVVLSLFYGHPGLFASATHRAINIARREQISAYMRPGISSLDYIIADLGFDPAIPGMASFEATDLLMRCRPLDTSIHNIIWQLGVLGASGYNNDGFKNLKLTQFKNYLLQYYSSTHIATNYIASQFAGSQASINEFEIQNLDAECVSNLISFSSTIYIPPENNRSYNRESCLELGWITQDQALPDPNFYKVDCAYSDIHRAYIASAHSKLLPRIQNIDKENPILRIIDQLNFDDKFAAEFEKSPVDTIHSLDIVVSEDDIRDLSSRRIDRFWHALTRHRFNK